MKKRMWLPNALTIFRMVGSLLLLGLHENVFWMIYLLCGLSDMLDGFFARKFCAVSRMGSNLDSIADFLFVIACCVRIFPCLPLNVEIKVWIVGIAAVKLLTVALLSVRSGRLTVLHTGPEKEMGFLLFAVIPLAVLRNSSDLCVFLCLAAAITAIQEGGHALKMSRIV